MQYVLTRENNKNEMINLLKYKSLTEKLFSEARKKENNIDRKHKDNILSAGFSQKNDFIIIGEKCFYKFNKTKPEQQQELQYIFSSDWKKELYYGFAKYYAESIKQENMLSILILLGINPEKLSEKSVQETKNIGFCKKGNVSCEEDTGNFIYKSIHIAGVFVPKQKLKEKLKNEFPLKQKIEFTIKQKSKLPKIGAYTKAIMLLPFSLLYDLLIIVLLYATIGLVFLILKLKKLFRMD
ncbi:hypothetical protein [Capnocytophaga felis]|uniref:Uncharacterized protein n=1 Tax=Capnocytophaga felis TaxID=2267611 RepID=A0A5M4BAS4_9FLAO|nr:hypothetical protein [Capnocytophaga felis]GET46681.1 hypothetical protein RCZ01_19830 [Capnocytophaga felis]GET48783.1 hypothetical protein RCZ02_16140 [Capnocytophaga felis]